MKNFLRADMFFVCFHRDTSPDLKKKGGFESGSSKHISRVPTCPTLYIYSGWKFFKFDLFLYFWMKIFSKQELTLKFQKYPWIQHTKLFQNKFLNTRNLFKSCLLLTIVISLHSNIAQNSSSNGWEEIQPCVEIFCGIGGLGFGYIFVRMPW